MGECDAARLRGTAGDPGADVLGDWLDSIPNGDGRVARGVCVRRGADGEDGLEVRELRLEPTRGGSWDLPRVEVIEPWGVERVEGRPGARRLPPSTERDEAGTLVPLSSASTCV